MSDIIINGYVDLPFEPVKEVFDNNFKQFDELGSAFSVKHNGQTVVDLKAGPIAIESEVNWSDQTLVNVWSSTKGIVAICYCILVSRGLISYKDKVCKYWPEFGVNNKSDITIADLLSHKAGLAALHEGASIQDLLSIKAIDELANATPLWAPSKTSGYHILTYGTLVTELFRRIEGRSLKKFIEQEFYEDRCWDIHIGLPSEREIDAAEISVSHTLDLSIRNNASELQHRVFTSPTLNPLDANLQEWKSADLPSANGFSNAKAIADIYAALINSSDTLVSKEALSQAIEAQFEGHDIIMASFSRWACGFVLNADGVFGPNPNSFGHSGLGGSLGFADPDNQIAISYTPNRMGYKPRSDPRAIALIDMAYSCLAI
jgi:CubicO group peptidase (beta-lactamase class C family)